ncbi:MAG TPA: MarR family transcriptional regulator [Dermatophilaceae bacterium]|nr:MarR family transcriptional regulator [Dermatophilaceae bacterium]
MPLPRWLDEAEQRAWRAYLRARRLLDEALERDLQRYGVSLSEYEIISLLSEVPQRHLRMSTLADRVVQSRSRLTHTATRLEGRGWVQRRRATCDRRGVELCLTEDGWAAVQGLAPVHVDSVRRHLIDHLTAEQFTNVGEAMVAVGDGILSQRTARASVVA